MKILVVVDMQNDFITGSLGTKEAQAIVPRVKAKVEEYVKNDDFIIYTRDTHWSNYLDTREGEKLPVEHCMYGSDGWRIPAELYPPASFDSYLITDKFTFGARELPGLIRRIMDHEFGGMFALDEIEIVGLCTDICVVSNALILKADFYGDPDISVDAACCAGVTPETHEAALKTMEMCQINVKRG